MKERNFRDVWDEVYGVYKEVVEMGKGKDKEGIFIGDKKVIESNRFYLPANNSKNNSQNNKNHSTS